MLSLLRVYVIHTWQPLKRSKRITSEIKRLQRRKCLRDIYVTHSLCSNQRLQRRNKRRHGVIERACLCQGRSSSIRAPESNESRQICPHTGMCVCVSESVCVCVCVRAREDLKTGESGQSIVGKVELSQSRRRQSV